MEDEIIEDDIDETEDMDMEDEEDFFDDEEDDSQDEDTDDNETQNEESQSEETEDEDAEEESVPDDIETIRREAYERGLREARLKMMENKTNHYTGEPIKDEVDIRTYEVMQQIEKGGGDPVKDFYRHVQDLQRKDYQRSMAAVEREKSISSDMDKFVKDNPNVNLKELFADNDFGMISKYRLGKESLASVYADYMALKSRQTKTIEQTAQRKVAKQKASPGALGGGQTRIDNDYANMSDAEFEKVKQKAKLGKLGGI